MIHLFIDTNRYLTLFELQKEELGDIEKIVKCIRDKKITLWLPEQVKIEVERNIEPQILLKKYTLQCKKIESIINKSDFADLPKIQGCEEELSKINKAQESIKGNYSQINSIIEQIKNKIRTKIREDAEVPNKVINELFSAAKFIPYDEALIKKAFNRNDLRTPPGKNGSYGDSVIWETLLKEFPERENIHFVGFDSDFRSDLDNNEFSPFLTKEWAGIKKSKIIPYKHIGGFTKKMIPEIESSDKIIEQETKADKEHSYSLSVWNIPDISIQNELRKFNELIKQDIDARNKALKEAFLSAWSFSDTSRKTYDFKFDADDSAKLNKTNLEKEKETESKKTDGNNGENNKNNSSKPKDPEK